MLTFETGTRTGQLEISPLLEMLSLEVCKSQVQSVLFKQDLKEIIAQMDNFKFTFYVFSKNYPKLRLTCFN